MKSAVFIVLLGAVLPVLQTVALAPNHVGVRDVEIGPPLIARLAKREGWHKAGSLARRLHNPGMLVYARQPGARKALRGFASFGSDADGWRAIVRDVLAKKRRGQNEIVIWCNWDMGQTCGRMLAAR